MHEKQLLRLVQHYQAHVHLDQHLAFYQQLPTIEQSIDYAALAKLENGKRHPHQRRLPRQTLEEVKQQLLTKKQQVEAATSFEAILAIVRSCTVPRFGELACYDTALRLAVRLDKLPSHVYLHRGIRRGASALGLAVDREYIPLAELPQPLQTIQPYQVEDFLCIYKTHLSYFEPTHELSTRSCAPANETEEITKQSCVGQKQTSLVQQSTGEQVTARERVNVAKILSDPIGRRA